jgi:pectin methylesterase-like acyl-CoA thioesterase
MYIRSTLAKPTQTLWLACTGLLLSGCATMSTDLKTPMAAAPADSSRAAAVFMYQSRVASTVLDRYAYLEIEGAADLDPILVAADARMAEVCRYLNEAAVGKAEGSPPSWDLKFKVFATTNACAHAAHEVELLLENSGNSIATAKL